MSINVETHLRQKISNFSFATETQSAQRTNESRVNKFKAYDLRLITPDCKIVFSVVLCIFNLVLYEYSNEKRENEKKSFIDSYNSCFVA